jgi:hypothetical protein
MLHFRAATQHQVTGHRGGLQKGYPTVEAANDAWAHGLATQTAYVSGQHGPTPTRKPQTRKRVIETNDQRSSPPPSTKSKYYPVPSISASAPLSPAAYAKKTKPIQSMASASTSVQSRASPSMQTISDPWWVVVQGSYPGVYRERYVVHYTLFLYLFYF